MLESIKSIFYGNDDKDNTMTLALGRELRGVFQGLMGQREGVLKWRLRTIHPNPGPNKRDKTEEGKWRRMERRGGRRRGKLTDRRKSISQ